MRSVYLPGSSFADGNEKLPLSSLTTEIAMVEPSFLALTTTPSIAPSSAEVTWPVSLPAACAKGDDTTATANAAEVTSNQCLMVMAFSQSVTMLQRGILTSCPA